MEIGRLIGKYERHLKTLDRSFHTIRITRYNLRSFVRYLENEGICEIEALNREVIEDYQQELAFSLTARGTPLAIRSQAKKLNAVTGFTRFLKEADYLVHDPAANIKRPREPGRLPGSILSRKEIRQLMRAPDMQSYTGYRDRVLLEILYDTAIRRAELSNIKTIDADLDSGYVRVIGKGNKERVVPMSRRVCDLVLNYIRFVRPALLGESNHVYLMVNDKGGPMRTHTVWRIVKACARQARLKKNVTTHTFRHTCATHMLKNGAPIRHLQEMLGHESLESTQIYTRVTINDLKEIHAKYHPGAQIKQE